MIRAHDLPEPGRMDAAGRIWIGDRLVSLPARRVAIPQDPALAAKMRRRLEQAIETAITLLDALDADTTDLEPVGDDEPGCEDEGGACEDEGHDSDSEPDDHHCVPAYAEDGADQTRIVTAIFGDQVLYAEAR